VKVLFGTIMGLIIGLMLLPKLIQTLSDHWQEIASQAIRRIRQDKGLPEMGKFPEADLRERARAILQHLGTFLTSREGEIAEHYERLGRTRFEEGVPLHEVVRALQIIKSSMIEYGRRQGMTGPLDVYAEEELEIASDRIFDLMIFYVVRGYEKALLEAPAKFGSRRPKRQKEPEFLGPSPF
jgi:hypothetical protein